MSCAFASGFLTALFNIALIFDICIALALLRVGYACVNLYGRIFRDITKTTATISNSLHVADSPLTLFWMGFVEFNGIVGLFVQEGNFVHFLLKLSP